jgi:hypothetical protein
MKRADEHNVHWIWYGTWNRWTNDQISETIGFTFEKGVFRVLNHLEGPKGRGRSRESRKEQVIVAYVTEGTKWRISGQKQVVRGIKEQLSSVLSRSYLYHTHT